MVEIARGSGPAVRAVGPSYSECATTAPPVLGGAYRCPHEHFVLRIELNIRRITVLFYRDGGRIHASPLDVPRPAAPVFPPPTDPRDNPGAGHDEGEDGGGDEGVVDGGRHGRLSRVC